MTRGSITGQVKALAMIVAIEGLIPNRLAASSEKKSAPSPTGQIYAAAWLGQQGKTTVPQPSPDLVRDEDGVPDPPPGAAADAPSDLGPAPSPAPDLTLDSSEFIFAHPFSSSETTPSAPHAPVFASAPDNRVPFSMKKNPFARRH